MSSVLPRRIAVDAMGGDHAPRAEVEGSLAALAERPQLGIVLVGDEAKLRPLAAELGGGGHPRLTIHHASQVIGMSDHPGTAVKSKKDASMRVAFELAKRGEVGGVVSAGNSGAMLACGLFVMKRLRGVDRPGIITLCPSVTAASLRSDTPRHSVVLDVGANTEVRAETLVQYAVLGATYARLLLDIPRPRVAVMSNGEEETKGTPILREAAAMLRAAAQGGTAPEWDFVGYVEGHHVFNGRADVIVTDGFTGNVALKTTEGATRAIVDILRVEAARSWRVKLGAALMKPAFDALKRRLAWDEYGGAPLLGIDGVAVICHGRSTGKAIMNGIFTAERFVDAGLAPALAAAIARHRPLWQRPDAASPASPVPDDGDAAGDVQA